MNIEENIAKIKTAIEIEVDAMDGEAICNKLNDLINISTLSAETLAAAKLAYRKRQEEIISEMLNDSGKELISALPASTLNELIKSKAAEAESVYDLADRIDKRISYAIDGLRSMSSALKNHIA